MKKNYLKIILDILMALTFALLMSPRVLGLPFHEIAGLVIGVAVLTHIGLNYHWVINTTKKIFNAKLPGKTRFSYALNVLLLISMSTIIITGIMISKVVFPNLAVGSGHMFRGLHNLAANTTLALIGLHIGVHWQWVMSIFKKMFKSKAGKLRAGVVAAAVLSIAILAGGIQWYSSTSSSSAGAQIPVQQKSDVQSITYEKIGFNTQDSLSSSDSNFQGPPDGGDFHEGHDDGGSPFLVILKNLGLLAVLILPVYYLEKRNLKKKRKAIRVQ